jgi:hypothetical protein
MTRRQVNAIRKEEAQGGRLEDKWVQSARHDIELQHGMIPCTLNPRDLTERLLSAVKIATAYREDIDQWSNKRTKASRTILNLSSPDDPIVTKYMEERKASSIVSNERHSIATPEDLERFLWNIGIQTAKETVWVTTQKGIRTAIHPTTRRVLWVQRLRGTWYMDTLLSKVKSKLGNTCNVYTHQGKFTRVVPMTSRKDAGKSLVDFTDDDVGIPARLVTDGATEFTGRHTEFVKEARRMRIMFHTTEQGQENQNHAAEQEICFLAKNGGG